MRTEEEWLETAPTSADPGEALRRTRDLFEQLGHRYPADDPRRLGFTRFSHRSLQATVAGRDLVLLGRAPEGQFVLVLELATGERRRLVWLAPGQP